MVAARNGCHDINRWLRAELYADRLEHDPAQQMQNMGAPVAPEDWPTVTTYLMKNFPEKTRPAAAVIPGPAQVS